MNEKYRNKYRIPSARLATWDYGWQAMYFVTICTVDRRHFFGSITDGVMALSDLGKIAEDEWTKTPTMRPDMHLELDAFCVMPNHFHAIIAIGGNVYNTRRDAMPRVSSPEDARHRVSTGTRNQFGPQSKNLASIMRGYKSAVTTQARNAEIAFSWQPRYHDHIIRNDTAFQRIRQYVIDNALHWCEDSLYVE